MRRGYNKEFKIETVRMIREGGLSIDQVAKSRNISGSTLRAWLRHFGKASLPAATSAYENLSLIEEKLRQANHQIAGLQEENQILRKAIAILVR